jgi:hypothetical protein
MATSFDRRTWPFLPQTDMAACSLDSDCPGNNMVCLSASYCACAQFFAWADDPSASVNVTCTATTSATSGNGALFVLTVVYCALTFARFAPMIFAAFCRRQWKYNSAGSTFVFALVALFVQTLVQIAAVVLTFNPSTQGALLEAYNVGSQVTSVLLALAVLNMSFAFLELSSGLRLLGTSNFYRRILFVIVGCLVLIVALEIFLTPTIVSTITGVVIIVGVAVVGLVGPGLLYIRSARSIVRTLDINAPMPKLGTLMLAMVRELFFVDNAMVRAIGLSTGSLSRDSRNSRDASRESEPPQHLSRQGSKERLVGGDSSKDATPDSISRSSSKKELVVGTEEGDMAKGAVNTIFVHEQRVALSTSARGGAAEPATSRMASWGRVISTRTQGKGSTRTAGAFASPMASVVSKQHSRMIHFLGRTIRMGFWLAVGLFVFIGFAVVSLVTEGIADSNSMVKQSAVFGMFLELGYTEALYQILMYLEPSYLKRAKVLKTWSRPVSKESKDGASKLEVASYMPPATGEEVVA